MDYYIWAEAKTINGLRADEVISGVQKSIRRNNPENAARLAYELYTTSPALLEKLWSRILTISVEDIGFGNLDAVVQVSALNDVRKQFAYEDVDQPMFFIHAIRILCASEKDRSSDYLKNIVIKSASLGEVPVIPDVALDKHTKRGKELGRGSEHFFHEGAIVIPQMDVDNDYKERYEEILKNYDKDKIVESAFRYSNKY